LGEGHAEKLVEAGEVPDSEMAAILPDAFIEFVPGKEVHQLCENRSSWIHWPPLSIVKLKEYGRKY